MKYISWLTYAAAGCILGSSMLLTAQSNEIDDTMFFDTEEFFDAFELTEEDMHFPTIDEMIRQINFNDVIPDLAIGASRDFDLKQRINTISQILTTGLYRTTQPMMKRNILDLPAVSYIHPLPPCTCKTYFRPFYNHTEAVAFKGRQETINAVTNLNDPSIIQALEELVRFASEDLPQFGSSFLSPETLDTLNAINPFDVPEILTLFADIFLQQRRVGGVFEHTTTQENWSLTVQLPLIYMESNFYAEDEVQDCIADSNLIQQFSTSGSDDGSKLEAFLQDHLVADRIGLGDLRLTLLHTIHTSDRLSLWGGLEATLPTAFDFTQGLVGGEFPEHPRQPQQPLLRILNASKEDASKAQELAINESINVLDRITRIFADRPLGQEHFGIAPICTWYFDGTACNITGSARIEYLTPRSETRFFREPVSREELAARNYRNAEKGEENFNFLEKKIVNVALPQAFEVRVKPRLSPRINIALGQTYDTWQWHTGFDFWYYQRERIDMPDYIQSRKFVDISAAERPSAYQVKLFADANTDVATNHFVWHVGMALDGTIAYKSIGQDFTVSLYIGTTW